MGATNVINSGITDAVSEIMKITDERG
ncbi:hypothetical protein, partial [Escherichia coli]